MIFQKPARGYRIRADRDGLRLDLDDHFWHDEPKSEDGTPQIDRNIAQVVEEIRAALYYIHISGLRH